jgi:hypothetical protein
VATVATCRSGSSVVGGLYVEGRKLRELAAEFGLALPPDRQVRLKARLPREEAPR